MALILGIHVSQKSHVLDDKNPLPLHESIPRDLREFGLNACQIFTYGPRILSKNKYDIELVKKATEHINLTVHSAYPTTGIWKGQTKAKLTLFRNQLQSCRDIGAWGMVLHINKIKPDTIAAAMQQLLPIARDVGVCILLEMIASKADPMLTYETPEKLDRMCDTINAVTDASLHKWYGITIDTAHLWGAGFDDSKYIVMKNFFLNMKHAHKIMQIHLNGSSSDIHSGKDKHEIPFCPEDKIWSKIDKDEAGIRAVVEFAFKNKICMICEINRGEQKEVERSLNIIKGYVG